MKQTVKNRGIKLIWHFTKIENLDSILQEGIIPRATLDARGGDIEFNDSFRYDEQRDANCLSIGYPNYKMFYRLQQEDKAQDWVICAVKPNILWLKECAFCNENAASNNVTAIPIERRKGKDSFEKLFEPVEGKPDRTALKLPDDYPTNPQAEVLVFGVIEPRYIIGAAVPNKDIENELKAKHSDFEFRCLRSLFRPRLDYAHW